MTDTEELISSQPRTRGAVQVHKKTWKGHPRADVREWYFDAVTGELKPGRGVALKPHEIREVITALTKIAEAFEAEGE